MNQYKEVIFEEHFNGNNLFAITLIHEPTDKHWANPYYFLLTFRPKGVVKKNINGKIVEKTTYINEKRITFKRSVHNLQAMALAVNEYARGKGQDVAGKLTYWSDPNKSAFSGPDKEGLKTLSMYSAPHEKIPNERVVNFSATQSSTNGGCANTIVVTFTPWDALALVNSISYMIRLTRTRRLEDGPRPFGKSEEPTGTEG